MPADETRPLLPKGFASDRPKEPFRPEAPNPFGAIALFFLTLSAVYAVVKLYAARACPCFVLYPFIFTAWGGLIGVLWESRGGPLKWLHTVESIRRANVGFVLGFTAYLVFATASFWYPGSVNPFALLLQVAIPFYAGWLFMYSGLGQEQWRSGLVVPLSIVAMAAVSLVYPNREIMSTAANLLFVSFLVVMLLAFLIGGGVPQKYFSVTYHGGLVFAVLLGYAGVSKFDFAGTSQGEPWETCKMFDSFSDFNAEVLGFFADLFAVVGLIIGLVSAVRTSKLTYYEFRYHIVGPFWIFLHSFLLTSKGPMPPPATQDFSEVDYINFTAYERTHPSAAPMSVPSAEFIPLAQRFKYEILRTIFAVTNWGDMYYPVSIIDEHPKNKPRVDERLGIDYYWNETLLRNPPPKAPEAMKIRFQQGELLSYCLLYSHGFRDVREPTPDEVDRVEVETGRKPNRVLDYTKYERFVTKDGFSAYGGKAYFVALDAHAQPCYKDNMEITEIELLGVVAPRDSSETIIRRVGNLGEDGRTVEDLRTLPGYEHFNYIQKSIHATSLFVAVALHHLFEIHTVTSITSVALSNAFDRNQNPQPRPHPFRAVMQLHYYSSTEVQEVTTPHLLNNYSTFPQVFALRAPDMALSVNDHYHTYEYMADCDFETRAKLMNTPQMRFEMAYFKIFKDYGTACVRAIWGDSPGAQGNITQDEIVVVDQRLRADAQMAEFMQDIARQMDKGVLPERFAPITDGVQRWSTTGVIQLIAETIHLHTVRHQYLGTKMALAAMDHRYSGLSAHYADDLPPPKEEYLSLILIVAATALKPFPTLLSNESFDTLTQVNKSFTEYLGSSSPDKAVALQEVFGNMTQSLLNLQNQWELDGEVANENLMRVLPKEVHIMAGY